MLSRVGVNVESGRIINAESGGIINAQWGRIIEKGERERERWRVSLGLATPSVLRKWSNTVDLLMAQFPIAECLLLRSLYSVRNSLSHADY